MQASLAALPGVEAAALSIDQPAGGFRSVAYRVEGQPVPEASKEYYAGYSPVSPGFLRVYGLHLVRGRDFRDSDRPSSPAVAILNEAIAKKWWPGEDPIGKRMRRATKRDQPRNHQPSWAEVVGVIRDFEGAAEFYNQGGSKLKFMVPWAQNNHRFITFNVCHPAQPRRTRKPITRRSGPRCDLAISVLATVEEEMANELSCSDFLRKVLSQTAGLGLLLSGVGIYGIMANLASERTKEIGIRMALGARPGSIVWLFLRNGIQLAMMGAAIGLVTAFSLTTFLGRMIPVLPGKDPWVVVGSALFLASVALFACWLPARRTSSVSPTIALRSNKRNRFGTAVENPRVNALAYSRWSKPSLLSEELSEMARLVPSSSAIVITLFFVSRSRRRAASIRSLIWTATEEHLSRV